MRWCSCFLDDKEDLSIEELMSVDISKMRKVTEKECSEIKESYHAEEILIFKEDKEMLTDRFHYLSAVTNMHLRPTLMLLRAFGIEKNKNIEFNEMLKVKTANNNNVLVKITLKNK